MPTEKAPDGVEASLQPDKDAVIPRMRLGEQGFVGLKTSSGKILEETQAAFKYPQFFKTIAEMRTNPTVAAALGVWRMMISRVQWDVEAPANATEVEKERVKAVRSMMHDMDQSWASFIESVFPYLEYGYSVNEIVLRRRLKRNGSKHNDGLVGIKKLPTRAQETITGWIFSEDGADLLKIEQDISILEHSNKFQNRKNVNGKIEIDRDKFLLFSASATKGNPEGNSILKSVYLAHKQMLLLQDQELLTASKDMQGALKITIPPKYLGASASDDDKAVVAAFQKIIDNYSAGKQRGLLVPGMIDPESKLPLFTYELLESKGSAKVDLEGVIKRLQNDIAQALCVDVLRLGAEGTGSFSLAETKSSILALAIDYRLKEISEVLNTHLIRLIYEMNGWDTNNLPKFVYADIEEVSLEDFSKAIQRIVSTSAIELDRAVMNRIREVLKMPLLPSDEPVDKEKLPANMSGQSSKSGAGMEVGTTGDGTAKNANNGKDRSTSNNDNAA